MKRGIIEGNKHEQPAVSKLLEDLVNDASDTLGEICQRLDTRTAGLGDYENIAKYYGYKVSTVRSRFETSPNGPSKALILAIIAEHPDVTVESFAEVVVKQTRREDVVRLLREFDVKALDKLNVTLVTSDDVWKITVIDEMLTELAKNPLLRLSVVAPNKKPELLAWEKKLNIKPFSPQCIAGFSVNESLAFPPDELDIDVVITHSNGEVGKQAQVIKRDKNCRWVHLVYTISEELAKFGKEEIHYYEHDMQVQLCELADIIIAIGPKVAEAYRNYLAFSGKCVFNFTPGVCHDLIDVRPVVEHGMIFRIMVSATYYERYFEAKGLDIAAKAIHLLKDSSYQIFFLVTPEEDPKVLESRLKGLLDHKQFTVKPFQKNAENWKKLLCRVQLAILPSRAEGFGTSILPALSADVPVLVGGNTGLGMAVKKLRSGAQYIIDSDDPEVWAKKIKEVKEKGTGRCSEDAKKLREEYMKNYSKTEQCHTLVEKMLEMFPDKQGLDESVSFKPGALSQDDVLGIAHELGSSWKMVGRVLNVPDAVIDQIEANKSEVSDKCYSILRRWQEMYPSDATYHRLARALQHPTVDRVDVAVKYCGPQFGKDVAAATDAGSSVPAEIRGRGPEAERAFQKAMKSGKLKVYRGRIMLLGQDRAGKTSLKKSLLGLPFDPEEESTVGVKVDRSKCELEVDEVQNWMLSKRKKGEMSEFEEELARLIVMDLRETKANDSDSTATDPNADEVKITDELEERKDYEEPKLLSDVHEPVTDTKEKIMIVEDGQKAFSEQQPDDKNDSNELQLNINSTILPKDVTDLVVRYLQNLQLEDDIKSEEVTLTLWDFAGQHLYYASHSVFLSGRAVYILVYNLSKNLLATAEPCVRQGVNKIRLDNANNETNLDNLLSWLVSVHNIRSAAKENVAHQGKKLPYLQPPVIIVGTNLDQPFEEVNTMEQHIKESLEYKEYEKHVTAPFFAVDNKRENDEGVQRLRQNIVQILKNEPYMGEEVPLRWFKFERAVDALVAKQTYFMDLDQLLSVIRQVCQIEDEEDRKAMLNFYHDLGVIVKHGQTVVLQARWLIDLFKQLIMVPPFDEADPLHRKWWRDLEVNGILSIALVDLVFSKFIDKGLCKQDILDLMELHGLIAKFSIATDENQDEQRYFVPTQLRSSPSALCEIKPSGCDPCPLFLHFLDGFVPHGLFPQLVSKFIHWCAEKGFKKTPQLFNNGARLFMGKPITFALILICRKRFIKIVLKTMNPCSCKSQSMNASNKMARKVRKFIKKTLDGFSRDLSYLSNLQYEFSVVCTHCQQRESDLDGLMSCCHDDRLHLLQVCRGEELICMENLSDEMVKVPGWEMWFEVSHSQTKEPKEDVSEAVGASTELKTTGREVETKKRKQKKNFTGHSSGVLPKRKEGIEKNETAQPSVTVHEIQQEISDESISQDDVLLIAHELGSLWKMFGRALNVPDAVIDQIEANKSGVTEKCYSLLTCWQKRYPKDATFHRLALALKHDAVRRADVAEKFCGL
ncbi:uncharacterized protein LOC114974232 [Acropora millepora]|uniref:uncharacterized protein LOC114974232 n=1 Tax=Acropora millepora TaxID=45264 RepID=UPI001CF1BFFC|nr:uncharacterized protein LOC114974232 [Acropora millepora]XP_044169024.1 uncharacterized protein LOC114974232 [Acropora millepora]XP_044169025.1 uncharacterized protein LOC114974232 [Acropora millepora]